MVALVMRKNQLLVKRLGRVEYEAALALQKETELLVQAGAAQIVLMTHGRPVVNPGDKVRLSIDPAMVHVFDQKTGARIAA